MRFYKTTDAAESPEKQGNRYLNIRSAQRIDLRPHETLSVATDLGVEWAKTERVKILPVYGSEYFLDTPGSLWIKLSNPTDKSIHIYPGTVVASVEVYKTASLVSEVQYAEQ